jgi:hypothetical protein
MEMGSLMGWTADEMDHAGPRRGAVPFSLFPESASQKDIRRKSHFSGAPRHMQ